MTNPEKEIYKKNNTKHVGSVIFRHNRSLGYVTNHIPAVIRYIKRRRDNLIITCIGRFFHVYTASHFRLLHVSNQHPDEITALAADRLYTFTASDTCIYAWRAGKHIRHVYTGHTKNVHLLLPFGQHLLSVDEANILKIWSINEEEVYLELEFSAEEFLITAIAHPPTYINKILLGSKQGKLKMWNIKYNRLIHTYNPHTSRVNCIEPSTHKDFIAIGYQDGAVIILSLQDGEILLQFKQDWGSVTRITFRTDGPPIMATSCTNGYVAFWNLEERKVAYQLQTHEKSVTTAICLPNEPLLLTTSPDNSMKLWIFDMPDGGARMLRIREGHTLPPLCIRYHGSNGSTILSSGEDSSLRAFSTVSETFNKSLGKATYNRKASKKKNRFEEDNFRMPPIIEFTTETTREKEWDNVVAIHASCIQSTTWSFHRSCMGEHRLIPKSSPNKTGATSKIISTCVTLTNCGNFAIIGYSDGRVERFNIQSGLHRASYGAPAHESAIRGIATDNLNQMVVTGCCAGQLKFWHFKENVDKFFGRIQFPDGIILMRSHRESAMLAIAFVNFLIKVVDMDTKAIVRKFEGHSAKINDLTISPDSRWLISSSMDGTIKVWDVPSAYMIDHFRTERPCVSLTMSPTGDFLATAHVNNLGIYLWANKTLFSHISLRSMNPYSEAPFVDLPQHRKQDEVTSLNKDFSTMEFDVDTDTETEEIEGEEIVVSYETPEQLSNDLITMSTLASSRWQNLLDLEIIKKHNKPKAPPQKPKQAPFFLPTVAGLDIKFDFETQNNLNDESKCQKQSRILEAKTFNNLTTFGKLLEKTVVTQQYEECVQYLKLLGPSMIDFEVKSLHPIGGGTATAMVQYLKTLQYMFECNRNFELAQSYLSVFLRVHGMDLLEMPNVMHAIQEISKIQENSWQKIEQQLVNGIGVVSSLRNFVHL